MRPMWIAVLALAACEQEPVEPRREPAPAPAPAPARDPEVIAVAQTSDAAVALADAAPAKVALERAAPDASTVSEEEAARYVQVLTAEGPSGDGVDLGDTAPAGDLAEQVKIGGNHTRGTGKGPRVGSGAAKPTVPKGRIKVTGAKAFDEASLDADAVKKKISSVYMAGMQRCYKTTLATNPTLAGDLRMELEVTEKGRVVSPSVTAPDDALATCVESMMAGWSFPKPTDADGEPTTASFELHYKLVVDAPSQ